MLIGRKDGPRFEASREGVRFIGFSRWPEPLPRTASNGRPLKRSYAERVDEIGVRASRGGRVTSASWEEILRLSVGWQATPDAGAYADVGTPRTAFLVSLAHVYCLPHPPDKPQVSVDGGWDQRPMHGVALFELTTTAGTWFLDAPLDRRGFDATTAAATQALLDAYRADAVRRAELPETWPTGTFRPGLD
ncbi:hypothetical protein [Galactobacter valiniphilus]|uniref:hypothetical protein n=1 Tax=Galactobacter valiniphilus TaxID=2676122 RepID=UPI003735A72B